MSEGDILERLRPLVEWLVDGARSANGAADVLAQLCERASACGLPLYRVAAFVRTLHPDIMGRRFLWRPGAAVEVTAAPYTLLGADDYLLNPVARVTSTGQPVRRRLIGLTGNEFPILAELAAEGVTDYLAEPMEFTNGEIHVVSWTTKRSGGFTDHEIRGLELLSRALARVAEVYALRRMSANLLDTYVGRNAGERILGGHIQLGDMEAIHAAILLADLRGFSDVASARAPRDVIALLNDFFASLIPPIDGRGGEVLKFIGDAVLAIFPVRDGGADEARVCADALAAAEEGNRLAASRSAERVDRGELPLHFRMALHVGEVSYGNIGASGRLDFTAIGRAVNLVARLEQLAGVLGRSIVVSRDFRDRCDAEFDSIGSYELKGFPHEEEVFVPIPGAHSFNA
jgi:adenylate cyclase